MQPTQTRKPSYLGTVKAELDKLTEEPAIWRLVRSKIAQSYWNGVADGASGKVKPKAQR